MYWFDSRLSGQLLSDILCVMLCKSAVQVSRQASSKAPSQSKRVRRHLVNIAETTRRQHAFMSDGKTGKTTDDKTKQPWGSLPLRSLSPPPRPTSSAWPMQITKSWPRGSRSLSNSSRHGVSQIHAQISQCLKIAHSSVTRVFDGNQ